VFSVLLHDSAAARCLKLASRLRGHNIAVLMVMVGVKKKVIK
jgi:hypothetical protein